MCTVRRGRQIGELVFNLEVPGEILSFHFVFSLCVLYA